MKKNDYLIVGKFLKPHGLKGEIKVLPITDDIRRFEGLKSIVYKRGDNIKNESVEGVRITKKFVILKLESFNSIKEADTLRNTYLYVNREKAIKINDSSYYYYDLQGCIVKTLSGEILGTLYDIQNAGSCDVYLVHSIEKCKGELLIPAISQVIKKIDVEAKEILIDIIDGLF